MKFCAFASPPDASGPAAPRYGTLSGETVQEISAPPWTQWNRTGESFRLASVRLLAPVEPRKIVCVGRNYSAHAAELGNEVPKEPLIFLKPPTSIAGPSQAIVLPSYSERVEHEGELGIVIGRRCAHLRDQDDALGHVLGYTCVNDVTARDLQKTDVQFTRAKGFDTFCPVGPFIESEILPEDLLVETLVNGDLRQSGKTSLMVFPPAFLVRWISRMMTLEPGDLIATGTPAGVGPLVDGDVVEVRIGGIGVLRNPVHLQSPGFNSAVGIG
jgi:2-keto-4-pentenoate hydratase/2-oxohepta-3-ene-1,7-dioic acid hydratase in catechol pathway